MKENSMNTRKVALSGILGALAVICLLLATVLPTNRLSFYALSSFFIAIATIENGIKAGWLFYAATSLLALIIVPEKLGLVPYVIFFGIYGLVKYYIEKLDKLVIEYVLKYVYFNICVGITLISVSKLFGFSLTAEIPWWLIIAALEIVFFIYDFVYTLFINYYREKLRPRLKLN